MVEPSNGVIEQLVMQVGYAGLLLYLTFRIFKVVDRLVEAIKSIDLKILLTVTEHTSELESTARHEQVKFE